MNAVPVIFGVYIPEEPIFHSSTDPSGRLAIAVQTLSFRVRRAMEMKLQSIQIDIRPRINFHLQVHVMRHPEAVSLLES